MVGYDTPQHVYEATAYETASEAEKDYAMLCIFCCVLIYAIYYIIPPVFLQDNFMT